MRPTKAALFMKGLIKKMIVIGIDIGGSITKIIGIKDGVQMQPLQVKATDPVTSLTELWADI